MPTRVARLTYLTLLAVLAPLGLAPAAAQDFPRQSKPVFVTIFDLRQPDAKAEVITEASAAISFPYSEISKTEVACSELTAADRVIAPDQLRSVIECALGVRLVKPRPTASAAPPPFNVPLDQRVIAATQIAANLPLLRKHHATRVISTRGSEIVAVVIQNAKSNAVVATCEHRPEQPEEPVIVNVTGRRPKFKITETERDTQLESDFETLIELVATFAPPKAAGMGAPAKCDGEKWKYEFTSSPVAWASAKPITLAQKRASVELKAMLPAVAPDVLAKSDNPAVPVLLPKAKAYLAGNALAEAVAAENEEQALFATCPPKDAARFEPAAHAGCSLRIGSLDEQLAAVAALAKMTQPNRLTVLRWAVENRPGVVRDRALPALGQATPAPAAPAEPKAAEAAEQTLKLVSGPLEHWSISANMFVSRDTTFKKADGQFGVDGVPPIFYVSLNFLVGDVLSDQRTFLQNVEVKWLLEGSKTPLDSMGVGLGLRGKFLSKLGLDFDAISPFVGMTWTKPDGGGPRVKKTRLGVSLDLKKALDWVK